MKAHYPQDKEMILNNIGENPVFKKKRKGANYYNAPVSFDIETTSINDGISKYGFMYEWTLQIEEYEIIGRYWEDFKELLWEIKNVYNLSLDNRMIIWIHNLEFEFQFMKNEFVWDDVFATEDRQPLYAVSGCYEFRCSYKLSGYSLSNLANNLTKHKINKLYGNLDYKQIRHNETVLSEEEEEYCVNDVLIIKYYIEEQIELYGNNINNIPLTNTGRVRKYCKKKCLYTVNKYGKVCNNRNYRSLMEGLTITEKEYKLLRAGFMGGFTHANALRVGDVCHNVSSFDFTSSYAAVMLSEKFPMSKGQKVKVKNEDAFNYCIDNYCCVFIAGFKNIREREDVYEHIISSSKCNIKGNYEEDNGRIIRADFINMVITDVDYKMIRDFYEWDEMKWTTFYIYRKEYLPKELIMSILDLYETKTKLKGVKGMEIEYQNAKSMLNSVYGCCATDIDKERRVYDTEWKTKTEEYSNIDVYNKSKNRFLSYVWSLFITAYARRNLMTAILSLGEDYIYSDTDSVKFVNYNKHKDYFSNYNKEIEAKLYECLNYYNIDINRVKPQNIKGEEKLIGIWDSENKEEGYAYSNFKTLGAKRYIYDYKGEYGITISGLSKKEGLKYLIETYGDRIYDEFKEGLIVPAGKTGKLTHWYIDNYNGGNITDYQGRTIKVESKSSIYLEDASFSLSLAEEFTNYLYNIREVSY